MWFSWIPLTWLAASPKVASLPSESAPLKFTLPGRTFLVSLRLQISYYLADTVAFFDSALKTEIYLTNGSRLLEKALFLPLHPIPPYPPFPLPHYFVLLP